jgi:hypothetical protein
MIHGGFAVEISRSTTKGSFGKQAEIGFALSHAHGMICPLARIARMDFVR